MASNGEVNYIFDGTTETKDLTSYALFRGVTDWADLTQFNQFESGYSFLVVLSIPKFMKVLAEKNDKYRNLIETYVHVLEYEFRGLEGIDNMTSDPNELTNGIKTLNVITKVNSQSNAQFTMRYYEKAGSLITKFHELFLRGIKDPTTQVKHYHGLIESGDLEPSFANEVFSFLYIVTDNTLRNVEKAFYIVGAQPTNADFNIYNSTKGQIEFQELSVEFNGFPIQNTQVNKRAQELLDWIRKGTIWNESDFTYSGDMEPYNNTLVGNGTGNTGAEVSFNG